MRVTGHAHQDFNQAGTPDREAVHIQVFLSDNNINDSTPPDDTPPEGKPVIYEDSRRDPPGTPDPQFKCRSLNAESINAPAPNVAIIEGTIRCFDISGQETFTLRITDNGPNPPNSDGYTMVIMDAATNTVEYSFTGATTVGGGDLTVVTS